MSHSYWEQITDEHYHRLLGHASKQADFIYLGSVGGGDDRGPFVGFSALASQAEVRRYQENQPLNPEAIAATLEHAIPAPHHDPTPCLPGGWAGFISYEFGYDTEPRLQPLRRPLPVPLFHAGLYLWMASYNRQTDQYFLWAHPDLSKDARCQLRQWQAEPAPEPDTPWQIVKPFLARQSESDFRKSVQRVCHYIDAGDCYQANLSQEFSATFAGEPWQAFRKLAETNPTPHSAFIRAGDTAVMSVSPERFLTIRDRTVTTSPIKGTRRRGENPESDARLARELIASEKDRAENLMIVDLLRNDLSRNAVNGSVEVDGLFSLESYRNVHHLVSHIRCELAPGVSPMKALFDAFPGGSITGAPKIRAMEIIRELEPHDRGPYCGSVFFRGMDGSLDSNIAIRTLYCDGDGRVRCCGGGGIVADSDPESEYQETLTKVKPLMDFLENLSRT